MRWQSPDHLDFFIDPEPLHRLPGVRAGVHRVRHASRRIDDPPGIRRPRARACRRCRSSACTASSRPAPRSARPMRSSAPATASCRSARKPRCIACGNCVLACPFGVPEVYEDRQIMMKCDMCYDRIERRQEADVRDRLPEPGAVLRHARADRAAAPACRARSTRFQFGDQTITTRVSHDGAQRDRGGRSRTST